VITTYTGENSFALGEALRELIDNFVTEHGNLTLERLDGEETDFADIQQALTNLPFLASKQLVILRAPGKNKRFVEQFEQLLDAVPETTDVIIVEPKLDRRLNYYKFLKKKTNFREFQALDQGGLAQWLTVAAKARHGSLNHADARYLVERVGISQQLVAHELDKLLLYDPQITRQTIDLLTDPVPQSTVFQLLEAAFSGRSRETLDLYAQQRALKVEPQQIIALLAWQLHVVAVIKTAGDRTSDQIAQEASMSPYVTRKSQTIAKRLSLADLRKLVANLATIDSRLKSTSIDADDTLQHYLLSLKS
jgi:DNA polymerase-3 subunit delta